MNGFNTREIEQILGFPDIEPDKEIPQEIFGVIYSLGRDAENEEEAEYAYQHLLSLCNRRNAGVRAYAILGLSLLATKRGPDKEVLEPIIMREWKMRTGKTAGTLRDAVDDLNYFLGWNIQLR